MSRRKTHCRNKGLVLSSLSMNRCRPRGEGTKAFEARVPSPWGLFLNIGGPPPGQEHASADPMRSTSPAVVTNKPMRQKKTPL